MATTSKEALGAPEIGKALFGAVLDIDGAGHYPGLELINLVVCDIGGILPDGEVTRVRRVAHDFARRLVAGALDPKEKAAVLLDTHSEAAVGHLLRCLELDVPNAVKSKGWERTHFFPYTRSLVHWDARARQKPGSTTVDFKDIRIERRYFRGAGAYAYRVLRFDPDKARLSRTRAGFAKLYPPDAASPLELLAATLLKHGKSDSKPSEDEIEGDSRVSNDKWEDLYRDGICNIVNHLQAPVVQRVRAVMNWTSICLALGQAARAAMLRNSSELSVVVDCAGTHPQLRRAAQRCLKDHISTIEDVSRKWAESHASGKTSDQQIGKIRGFFANTAAAGGLLNAWKGRRHFSLKLPAIEALVLAAVPPGEEIEFESFLTDWLYKRCHIVAGREGASHAGLLMSFDATIFEENERRLADQMLAAGMLRVFSDATRMVSSGDNE